MSSVFKMTYMWNIIWGAFNNFEEKSSKIYKNLSILLQLQITQTLCSANFKEIDAFLKILEHFSSKLCTCQYFAPGGSVGQGWGFWTGNVALGWGVWSQLHAPGRDFDWYRLFWLTVYVQEWGFWSIFHAPGWGFWPKFFSKSQEGSCFCRHSIKLCLFDILNDSSASVMKKQHI